MNKFVVLALTLVSTVAMAFPKAGDVAEFKGKYEGGGGGSMDFTQTLTILSLQNGKASVRSDLAANGQVRNEVIEIPDSDLLSRQQVQGIFAQCAAGGGTMGDVVVPAGKFKACAVPQERGGMVWIAEVPFGIAKQISIDEEENKVTIELNRFVEAP